MQEYADRKQSMVVHLIEAGEFTAYPDALRFILAVKASGLDVAAASSSKNAGLLLKQIRLDRFASDKGLEYDFLHPGQTLLDFFDADVSGRDFAQGKPHPEMFVTAAQELGRPRQECFVIEDAVAGVQAAKAGGMSALGLARADDYDLLAAAHPDLVVTTLDDVDLEALRQGRLAKRVATLTNSGGDWPHEAALRSGDRVLVRPIRLTDKEALLDGFERMGPDSRYRRFFSPVHSLGTRQLRYLTEVDHHAHEALVAIDPRTGQGLGVARFIRSPADRTVGEVAVAVADDWQRQGIGTALLHDLTARAREEGIERFSALVLAENEPVLELLCGLGHVHVTGRDHGVLELLVDLPPRASRRRSGTPSARRPEARSGWTPSTPPLTPDPPPHSAC